MVGREVHRGKRRAFSEVPVHGHQPQTPRLRDLDRGIASETSESEYPIAELEFRDARTESVHDPREFESRRDRVMTFRRFVVSLADDDIRIIDARGADANAELTGV